MKTKHYLIAAAVLLTTGTANAATDATRLNGVLFGPGDASVYVSVKGTKGNNTADDTSALQAAATAMTDGSTLFIPSGIYKTTDVITISHSHIRIIGYGAKINQTGTLKGGLLITGSDVTIEGLWVYNNRGGSDWSNSAPTAAIGVEFSGSSGSRIVNCRVENWGGIGIKYLTSPGLQISGNRIIGVGAAGGLVANSNNNLGTAGYGSGAGSNGVRIENNYFSDLAQGAFQGNDWSDTAVSFNHFTNIIGQNAIYFDNIFNGSFVGNVIDTVGQCGIYLQVASNATQDGGGISIVGNTVQNAGQDGILFIAGSGGLTFYHRGGIIANNTIRSVTGNGIQLNQVDNYLVSNNVIDTTGNWGIFAGTTARNGRITGNTIKGATYDALYVATETPANTYTVTIEGNLLQGNNTTTNATTYYNSQMFISTGNFIVRNNIVQSIGGTAVWNLYTDATAAYTLTGNAWASSLPFTLAGTQLQTPQDGPVLHSLMATGVSTTANGYTLSTSTLALNGAQQYSPPRRECGNGWGTTGGASQPVCFQGQVAVTQSTTPVGEYDISYSINGAAPTKAFYVNSAGDVAAPGGNARFLGGSIQRISSGVLSVCTDANCTGVSMGTTTTTTTLAGAQAGHRTTVADLAYTTVAGDFIVAYTSLTAGRIVTVQCTTAGREFIIKNESAGAFALTITPASGTCDGAASCATTAAGHAAAVRIYADGTNCNTY